MDEEERKGKLMAGKEAVSTLITFLALGFDTLRLLT